MHSGFPISPTNLCLFYSSPVQKMSPISIQLFRQNSRSPHFPHIICQQIWTVLSWELFLPPISTELPSPSITIAHLSHCNGPNWSFFFFFFASLETAPNSSLSIHHCLFIALGIKPKFLPQALDPVSPSDLMYCFSSSLITLYWDCLLSIPQTPKFYSHLNALLYSWHSLFQNHVILTAAQMLPPWKGCLNVKKSSTSVIMIYHHLLFSFVAFSLSGRIICIYMFIIRAQTPRRKDLVCPTTVSQNVE